MHLRMQGNLLFRYQNKFYWTHCCPISLKKVPLMFLKHLTLEFVCVLASRLVPWEVFLCSVFRYLKCVFRSVCWHHSIRLIVFMPVGLLLLIE